MLDDLVCRAKTTSPKLANLRYICSYRRNFYLITTILEENCSELFKNLERRPDKGTTDFGYIIEFLTEEECIENNE